MNIKTVLKSSVATAALVAIAAPTAQADIKNGNKNTLAISGQVVNAMTYIDDGSNEHLFIGDGNTTHSRLRWIGTGKLSEDASFGARLEYDVPLSNKSGSMKFTQSGSSATGVRSESNADGSAWTLRYQVAWVTHKKFGKVSLGHMDAAGNGSAQANLGGMSGLGITLGDTAGSGAEFVITGGVDLSGTTAASVITDFDATSRTDVIRYDMPKIKGLGIAVSLSGNGDPEIGASYSGKLGGFKVLARASYSSVSATSSTYENYVAYSAAVLHNSGVNASLNYGVRNRTNTAADPDYMGFMIGYKAKLFDVGGTNFAIAKGGTDDQGTAGNKADFLTVAAVQKLDAIGGSVSLQYNRFELSRSGTKFDDIDVLSLQTIFKF